MGYKDETLELLGLMNQSKSYPNNAFCAHLSNLGSDDFDGNIFVHPMFIEKMLDHIDTNDFGRNNVYLKKETVVGTFTDNLGDAAIHKGSLFKHFIESSETTMKYTYLVTGLRSSVSDAIPDDKVGYALTISPYSDDIELVSKHSHIVLNSPWGDQTIYSGGEMFVRKENGGIKVFINLATGTFYEIWQPNPEFEDEFKQVQPIMFELSTNLISLGANKSGIALNRTDIRVETNHIPTPKFAEFVPKNPSVIIDIANKVDKSIQGADIEKLLYNAYGIVDGDVQKIHKGRVYKTLSMAEKDRIRGAQSMAINIIQDIIRPRIYSSKVRCDAVVGVLLNAERILALIGKKGINIFPEREALTLFNYLRLDLVNRLYREIMMFSVPFEDIRARGENLGIVDSPKTTYISQRVGKNSFLNFRGMSVDKTTLRFSTSPFESFVVGKRLGAGNFGIVHEIDSYILKNGLSLPQITVMERGVITSKNIEVVVKIVLNGVLSSKYGEFKKLDLSSDLMHNPNVVTEASTLMNAYSVDFNPNSLYKLAVTEKLEDPDFVNDIENVCTDVLRDVIRIAEGKGTSGGIRGFVHQDIKPDNIMRKADGLNILIDMGMVRKVFKQMPSDGTVIYNSLHLNTVVDKENSFKGPRTGEIMSLVTPLADVYSTIIVFAEFKNPEMFQMFVRRFMNTREYKVNFLEEFENYLENEEDSAMKQIVSAYINIENDLPSHPGEEQRVLVHEFMDGLRDLLSV